MHCIVEGEIFAVTNSPFLVEPRNSKFMKFLFTRKVYHVAQDQHALIEVLWDLWIYCVAFYSHASISSIASPFDAKVGELDSNEILMVSYL